MVSKMRKPAIVVEIGNHRYLGASTEMMTKTDPNVILDDLPSVFYKYQSPGAARAVLDSASLRWTNPLTFNDAFEFQRMPRFEPTFAEARPLYVDTLLRHASVVFDSWGNLIELSASNALLRFALERAIASCASD